MSYVSLLDNYQFSFLFIEVHAKIAFQYCYCMSMSRWEKSIYADDIEICVLIIGNAFFTWCKIANNYICIWNDNDLMSINVQD